MLIFRTPLPSRIAAITIWPFIFVREGTITAGVLAHEKVHYQEQKHCLVIPWLLAYIILMPFYMFSTDPWQHPMERFAVKIQKEYNSVE